MRKIICIANIALYNCLILVFAGLATIQLPNVIYPTQSSKIILFIYFVVFCAGCLFVRKIVSRVFLLQRFSVIDGLLLVLFGYSIFNWHQPGLWSSIRYFEVAGLATLYVILRCVTAKSFQYLLLALIISGVIQSFDGLFQLLGLATSNDPNFVITGGFVNPGPYAGFLANTFAVSAAFYFCKSSLNTRIPTFVRMPMPAIELAHLRIIPIFLVSSCCIIILSLAVTGSRAAWISTIGTLTFLLLSRSGFTLKTSKVTAFLSTSIFLLLLIGSFHFAYLVKKDSADGRLFIWMITLERLRSTPVFGLGFDSFKSSYMEAQSKYFRSNENSASAMNAGDSLVSFNEPLTFAYENGITGLVILVVTFCVCMSVTGPKGHVNVDAAKAGLLSLFIFSCFSYPLELLTIKINMVLFLSVLSHYAPKLIKGYTHQARNNLRFLRIVELSVSVLVAVLVIGLFHGSKGLHSAYKQWSRADTLYRESEYLLSAATFESTFHQFQYDGTFLVNYGKALVMAGRFDKAVEILNKAKFFLNSSVLQVALGDAYMGLEDYGMAERCYWEAHYMVPSRFYPQYLLAKLYEKTGQHEKSIIIATELLNKRVKIESPAIDQIKHQMRELIKRHGGS